MFAPDIVLAAVINGLLTGAVYALVSVALTLVYGVLHIINFAHGAILTLAMFAAYFAQKAGVDPYSRFSGLRRRSSRSAMRRSAMSSAPRAKVRTATSFSSRSDCRS